MAEALEVEISAFNKYTELFTTWDGDQIAKLYCAPCWRILATTFHLSAA
jgi:hypothetical protein